MKAYVDELFEFIEGPILDTLLADLANPDLDVQVLNLQLLFTFFHCTCVFTPSTLLKPVHTSNQQFIFMLAVAFADICCVLVQDGVMIEEDVFFNIELRRVQACDEEVDSDGVSQEVTQMNHKVIFDR
jgi:hypothetical protein